MVEWSKGVNEGLERDVRHVDIIMTPVNDALPKLLPRTFLTVVTYTELSVESAYAPEVYEPSDLGRPYGALLFVCDFIPIQDQPVRDSDGNFSGAGWLVLSSAFRILRRKARTGSECYILHPLASDSAKTPFADSPCFYYLLQ